MGIVYQLCAIAGRYVVYHAALEGVADSAAGMAAVRYSRGVVFSELWLFEHGFAPRSADRRSRYLSHRIIWGQ